MEQGEKIECGDVSLGVLKMLVQEQIKVLRGNLNFDVSQFLTDRIP